MFQIDVKRSHLASGRITVNYGFSSYRSVDRQIRNFRVYKVRDENYCAPGAGIIYIIVMIYYCAKEECVVIRWRRTRKQNNTGTGNTCGLKKIKKRLAIDVDRRSRGARAR